MQKAGASTIPGLTQQDKIINYASVFVYNPRLRAEFKDFHPDVSIFESKFINNNIIFVGKR
jgi:hypothetical protein